MRSKIIIFGLVPVFLIMLAVFLLANNSTSSLISPNVNFLKKAVSTPSPTPIPTPKSFQFSSSTDLNQELESINPQLEEGDFEGLDSLIKRF